MPIKKNEPVDWEVVLAGLTRGKTVVEYGADHAFSIRDSLRIPYSMFEKAK